MSLTKRWIDEAEREELGCEPRYGEEVEQWPSEQEMQSDAEREEWPT